MSLVTLEEINSMITEGYITYEDDSTGMGLLRLTEKGFNEIYANSKANYEIAEELMDIFRRNNYRVGEMIPMRNITMQFLSSLNPVEQDRFEYVANTLIDARYITYEDGTNSTLLGLYLEQKGYDYIYTGNINDLISLF